MIVPDINTIKAVVFIGSNSNDLPIPNSLEQFVDASVKICIIRL